MQKNDKKFVVAISIFTVAAIAIYAFLIYIKSKQEVVTEAPATMATIIDSTPVLVINVLLNYFWTGYAILMLMLFLQWIIKRTIGNVDKPKKRSAR